MTDDEFANITRYVEAFPAVIADLRSAVLATDSPYGDRGSHLFILERDEVDLDSMIAAAKAALVLANIATRCFAASAQIPRADAIDLVALTAMETMSGEGVVDDTGSIIRDEVSPPFMP
jgi:hypothetical protein